MFFTCMEFVANKLTIFGGNLCSGKEKNNGCISLIIFDKVKSKLREIDFFELPCNNTTDRKNNSISCLKTIDLKSRVAVGVSKAIYIFNIHEAEYKLRLVSKIVVDQRQICDMVFHDDTIFTCSNQDKHMIKLTINFTGVEEAEFASVDV